MAYINEEQVIAKEKTELIGQQFTRTINGELFKIKTTPIIQTTLTGQNFPFTVGHIINIKTQWPIFLGKSCVCVQYDGCVIATTDSTVTIGEINPKNRRITPLKIQNN
jgi:hypothetical protein